MKRTKKGFTLAEMLIAVLMLGFVTLMAGVMTSAVLDTTVTMEEVSQAEVLGNEALENIQNEIRFGENVTLKNGSVTYDRNITPSGGNTNYRAKCTLGLGDSETDKAGMIVITYTEDGTEKTDPLFGGASYGKNLKITELKFSTGKKADGTEDNSILTFSVTVTFGGKDIWNGSASVKPLNGTIKTETA